VALTAPGDDGLLGALIAHYTRHAAPR
jgi:hypothetical protein